jgi:hypothetical protein
MTEVSNEQLLSVLLDMKGDIGEIKSTGAANAAAIIQHTASIGELQQSHARIKGFAGALSVVGAVVGAAASYAVQFFHKS